MGEAHRRACYRAATGKDWGLVGFKNSGGRRASRLLGRFIVVTHVLRHAADGALVSKRVGESYRRTTPRRHELQRVLRRTQGRGV